MSSKSEIYKIFTKYHARNYLIKDVENRYTDAEIFEQYENSEAEAIAALQTAVLAAAPEKCKPIPYFDGNTCYPHTGCVEKNEAIDDYTKALQQLFESEG